MRRHLTAWLLAAALALPGHGRATEDTASQDPLPHWLRSHDGSDQGLLHAPGADALFGIPLEEVTDDLLLAQLATLAPQRPGQIDLYALGVAGDADEEVFANEVHHFSSLMTQRFGADGRTLVLMNRDAARRQREAMPMPQAHLTNLRAALHGIAQRMDVDEDILMLYLTMHGTDDPLLHLNLPDGRYQAWSPWDVRDALDDAGIRHRVIVISACYSGGFEPALANDTTLLMTAARADRPSFGCGVESAVTWFGHAWLLEGMALHADPVQAFHHAERRIRHWEQIQEQEHSHPQLWLGEAMRTRLSAWHAQLAPGPAPPYWYAVDNPDVPLDRDAIVPADAALSDHANE